MKAIKERKYVKGKRERTRQGQMPNIKQRCGGKKSGCTYDLLLMPYCLN